MTVCFATSCKRTWEQLKALEPFISHFNRTLWTRVRMKSGADKMFDRLFYWWEQLNRFRRTGEWDLVLIKSHRKSDAVTFPRELTWQLCRRSDLGPFQVAYTTHDPTRNKGAGWWRATAFYGSERCQPLWTWAPALSTLQSFVCRQLMDNYAQLSGVPAVCTRVSQEVLHIWDEALFVCLSLRPPGPTAGTRVAALGFPLMQERGELDSTLVVRWGTV